MKIEIYYLSGTGNSLVIARHISSYFSESELYFIPKLMRGDGDITIAGELVGFVFPVYFARPPVVVSEFVQRACFEEPAYIFAVINGGGLYGRTLNLLNRELRQKGTSLNAGFIINMPGNHPKIASLQRKNPEDLISSESTKTEEIAERIKTRRNFKIETRLGLIGHILALTAFQKPYRMSLLKKLDSAYWVNENCNNCGTCKSICPANNITYVNSKPRWHNKCINCAACYHHCPVKAICLDQEDPSFRYSHPFITTEELIRQS